MLEPGGSHAIVTGGEEMVLLPLAGAATVTCRERDGHEPSWSLAGRPDVFAGPTDTVYLPPESTVTVRSTAGGRFALPGAKASGRLRSRYQEPGSVPVELRGAGNCSRRVVNYCMPPTAEAERALVCEVVTPGGNWSSYPPHKHDTAGPAETQLEEIYYFEVASGPHGEEGCAYQRVYGTADRSVDLLAEVRTGDVVLVPYGYHGPSMAAPGYDLYYLNVMAGPGPRQWLASDDPAHAWVRSTWAAQDIDSRLLQSDRGQSAERRPR